MRAKYAPNDFLPLLAGDGHLWNLPLAGTEPAPEPIRNAIGHAWSEIVEAHPGAYAKYRVQVFAVLLGLRGILPTGMVIVHRGQYRDMLAYMHLTSHATPVARIGEKFGTLLSRHTALFLPSSYVLLALCLLAMCRRQRDVLALLFSGLGLELSLLPLVQTPDYRYSHWLVICTCLAVVMLFTRRARDIATA